PALDLRVRLGQLVMPGVKKIPEHPEQIEIHEARPVINQERSMPQHLLERGEPFLKLMKQLGFLHAPLVEAAASELALLVPHKKQPVGLGNEIAPVNVREFEARPFDVVLNVAPENGLQALEFRRKQAQGKFLIQILGDDLRLLVQLEY